MISPEELEAFFRAIETRAIELSADEDPQTVFAGNVSYRASNGWTLTIFNDANEYDYVDSVVASDGRSVDFDDVEFTIHWHPDDPVAWRCLGIPGYCLHRCHVCGAQIPPRRAAPYLCGHEKCVGIQDPPDGTWVHVIR